MIIVYIFAVIGIIYTALTIYFLITDTEDGEDEQDLH